MERDIHSGYNDLKQVEMFVETAEKMVGQATMSLDRDMLEGAKQAIANAHDQLSRARRQATGVDEEFLSHYEQKLAKAEHQLNEALR
ncbi:MULTISPECIES: DUF2564 family protein [Bacillaceae]|jgi:vacuolar-type H+-ATPase subunit H|uniref:Vacuolar-type H+-ATPase subunit H n=3 Tax=Anoxybacillaceae TaxID=3120669 RepID=A0A6G9J3K8_9BACL|nr:MULTISPECIES: DUF2564 family protein [Bacillaceae]NNU94299.1 DUF2564 family protein [Geobacillus sp. NFOSA3]OQP00979.1 cytosolic protein [Geobacillus sp. 44C]MBB3867741.1 vacuolar-type H+-ATPase subunit H [Parageobacillus toebii NBRC 107807]MED4968440.1 DUF2564 family protein [Parageobacillus toebii]MED4989359.1 DUF2564 family protein [Parageobacillus toebii]